MYIIRIIRPSLTSKGLLDNSLNASVAVKAQTRNHLPLKGEKHYLARWEFGFIEVRAQSSFSETRGVSST